MSSSYPRAFSYYLSRLNNFSRQKVRILAMANTTFGPNQQIVLELPQGLIDLQTLTLQGYATTNAAATHGVYLPFAEGLLDAVSVEIGGVSIQNGFTNYGDLFKVFKDYQMADKSVFRRILQLENQQAALAADGVTNNVPFGIYNFLGFLGSVKVLDTTLMPPVKIYFRLSPIGVLTKHTPGSANAATYSLTDVRATVDIMDVSDGVYYNMVAQRLQSAPLEIPFDNYQTVVGTLAAPTQTTMWSTSSDCVEAIIATFKTATPNSHAANATTLQSEYFTRSGNGITTSQFKVNSIPYPAIPCLNALGDVFIDTAHSLGASQDAVGATDAGMNSLTNWTDHYWVHAHSFTYPDSEDSSHRLCGLSGRANQIQGSFETVGTGANKQPILWLKCKSVLRVGAGKFVEVVQ